MLPPLPGAQGKLGNFSQSLVRDVATTGGKLIQTEFKEWPMFALSEPQSA